MNCFASTSQLLGPQLLCSGAACVWATWACSAGAGAEPPLKKPPIAWPIDDPTATPAAVLAMLAKRPGPCEAAGAAAGVAAGGAAGGAACCALGGNAAVVAGRVCCFG